MIQNLLLLHIGLNRNNIIFLDEYFQILSIFVWQHKELIRIPFLSNSLEVLIIAPKYDPLSSPSFEHDAVSIDPSFSLQSVSELEPSEVILLAYSLQHTAVYISCFLSEVHYLGFWS